MVHKSRFARNAAFLAAASALLASCAHFQPEKVGQADGREYVVTVKARSSSRAPGRRPPEPR